MEAPSTAPDRLLYEVVRLDEFAKRYTERAELLERLWNLTPRFRRLEPDVIWCDGHLPEDARVARDLAREAGILAGLKLNEAALLFEREREARREARRDLIECFLQYNPESPVTDGSKREFASLAYLQREGRRCINPDCGKFFEPKQKRSLTCEKPKCRQWLSRHRRATRELSQIDA